MLNIMKTINYKLVLFIVAFLFCTGCTSINSSRPITKYINDSETLYVYKDGRLQYKSRFLNEDDVVIYSDGRGGEKAAVKVRVPVHSDFYRDSIVVVRVVNKFDETVTQNEQEATDSFN